MRVESPRTLSEALELRSRDRAAVVLAGGTDLLGRWHASGSHPDTIIVLTGIPSMRSIDVSDGSIVIGGCATHSSLGASEAVCKHLPALARAALSIGAPAIRNTGTIGGNLANASPAADLPPMLMAYGGSVRLVSVSGQRVVPVDRFHVSYGQTMLAGDELIESVIVPIPKPGSHGRFYKLGTRRAQAIAKVSVAGFANLDDILQTVRLAAGSVAEIPVRLREVEGLLDGQSPDADLFSRAARSASGSVSPIDDVRSTGSYRRQMVGVLVRRFLEDITQR